MQTICELVANVMERASVEVIRPYPFVSPDFCWSAQCVLCRLENEHSLEQHNALRFGIAL